MGKKNPPMWVVALILGALVFPFFGLVFSGIQSGGLHDALVAEVAGEEAIVLDARVVVVQDGVPLLETEGVTSAGASVLGDYDPALGGEIEVSYLEAGRGYFLLGDGPSLLVSLLPLLLPVVLVLFALFWEHGPIHMKVDQRKRVRIGLPEGRWIPFLWRISISLCSLLIGLAITVPPLFGGAMEAVEANWVKQDLPFGYGVLCVFLGMLVAAAYEIPDSGGLKKIRGRAPVVSSGAAVVAVLVLFLVFTTSSMIQSVSEGLGDRVQGRADVSGMDCVDAAGNCMDAVLLEYDHGGISYSTWVADYPDGVAVGDSLPVEWNPHKPWIVDFGE